MEDDVQEPERQDLKSRLDDFERQLILAALTEAGGVQAEAAARLGVKRTTLFEKMRRLGIRSDLLPSAPRPASVEPLAGTEYLWQRRLRTGTVVQVDGVSGNVLVTRSADALTHVSVIPHEDDEARAALGITESERGVALSVVRHEPEPPARARRGLAAVRVDFRVAVPPGVGVIVRLVNGDVRVVGVEAPVDARTANGSLQWVPAGGLGPAPVEAGDLAGVGED
ncbi:MAG TPA: helix-turn-helix domain-containing protein [Vicinamibacteria bacterium]|nr:helix-turn-helix domain-containing protein [Vicinamibacteria bacterium]